MTATIGILAVIVLVFGGLALAALNGWFVLSALGSAAVVWGVCRWAGRRVEGW